MKKKQQVDLSCFDSRRGADAGSTLHLINPADGTELGITITLAGSDSDIFKSTQRKLLNKRTAKFTPGRPFAPMSQEERDEDAMKIIVACTLSWSGVVVDGAELECTPENVRMVYERFPWAYEQVDAFVSDRKNFLS